MASRGRGPPAEQAKRPRLDCASACAPAHRGCTVQPEIFWKGSMPDGSSRNPPRRPWMGRTDVGNRGGFPHQCDPPTAVWVGREGCHQACSPPRILKTGLCVWVALKHTQTHSLAMSVGFPQRETPRLCHAKALEPAAPVLWHRATQRKLKGYSPYNL